MVWRTVTKMSAFLLHGVYNIQAKLSNNCLPFYARYAFDEKKMTIQILFLRRTLELNIPYSYN
jgi:hypothetical protein